MNTSAEGYDPCRRDGEQGYLLPFDAVNEADDLAHWGYVEVDDPGCEHPRMVWLRWPETVDEVFAVADAGYRLPDGEAS